MPTFNSIEDLVNHINKEFEKESLVSDVFSEKFMKKHTQYDNLINFLNAGGFNYESQSEFDNLDKSKLDNYIASSTTFSSWEEFRVAARVMQFNK